MANVNAQLREEASRLLAQSRLRQREGRHDESAALIAQALALDPRLPGAHSDLGLALSNLDRIEEAIASFERALEIRDDDLEALASLGILLSLEGRLAEAVPHYRRAIVVAPGRADLENGLGVALLGLDRPEEAVAAFRRTVELEPTAAEAHNNLGLALSRLGRTADAVARFRRAAELKPDYVDAELNLAKALRELGELEAAAACYRRVLALAPRYLAGHLALGAILAELKRPEEAIACCERALALKPDDTAALLNLGAVLHDCGRIDEAIACYERALKQEPGNADLQVNLANALRTQARLEEAIQLYRSALAREPGHALGQLNLGIALAEHGQHEEATTCFERALALKPDLAEAHYGLGRALHKAERYDAALAHFDQALSLRPGLAEALAHKGNALKELGRLDEARHALEAAIVRAPDKAEFYHDLAECKRFVAGDRHLAAMEALATTPSSLAATGRSALQFALGKAYSDLGEHERAFRHLLEGNALKRRETDYDEAATLAVLESVRAVFTPELMREKEGLGDPSRVPIFIVGMPRSGSTLVEQILASHPAVHGAGELSDFHDAVARLGKDSEAVAFPAAVPDLTGEQLNRLGASYLAALRARAPAAERITDKMLANFRFAGLIHLALPNARIIHIRRDPVDTCFSCFSRLFAGELPYTYDLAELGRYYSAYARLMEHWRELLPPGVMLEVQYEDVVADLECQARRIVTHCGLAWDERCLAFHETERPVRTASALQVRQPLYGAAVGRWRVYEALLDPLLAALGGEGGSAAGAAFEAALALQRQGKRDEAESLYREALRIDGAHCDSLHKLGALRLESGDAAEAANLLREALRHRPNSASTHNSLGLALQALGRHDEAVAAHQRALAFKTDYAEAANNLGGALFSSGRSQEAIAAFERALGIRPNYAEAHHNLGNASLALGRLAMAIAQYEQALACKPDFAGAHNNLGLALQMANRPGEARAHFERALVLEPENSEMHNNLGLALQTVARHDEAIAHLEQAIALKPDNAVFHSNLGSAQRELGRLAEARQAFEKAIEIAPRTPLFYRHLSDCMKVAPGDRHLAAMESLEREAASLPATARIDLHFALSKAYGDLGRFERALGHLLEGNALKRREIAYDEASTLATFERMREIFTPALMRAKRGSGHPSRAPVFIIGMPRSGSTLIEQILASHPEVFGGGELNEFELALQRVSGANSDPAKFIEGLPQATNDVLAELGDTYVTAVTALAPSAKHVTDKMPPNYLFAGLIHLALPNARIIHTLRDPIDTCLSCFSKLFAGNLPHAYDLGELGRYYRAYARLMEHWRAVLPPDVMLEVRYEEVVDDLECQARRIVDHCGLAWSERCLAFHRTERPVSTASASQVRQPIYRSAVGRWRSYGPQLGPLLEALALT